MTPHDCATQPVVTTWCEMCGHGSESEALDAILRRALTDDVQQEAVRTFQLTPREYLDIGEWSDADAQNAMRDVLIAAILTAARETNNG